MTGLALIPDAFGGQGGISQYNRDLLTAICQFRGGTSVAALPRIAPLPIGELPRGLEYVTSAIGSKRRYLAALGRFALRLRRFDFVFCGHINLLPVAYLASNRYRAPLFMSVHGIEAWQPSPSKLSNVLTSRLTGVLSVSGTTAKRFASWAPVSASSIRILPNTVDLDRFTPGKRRDDLVARYRLDGKVVIMTFGRLEATEQYKGFDQVLEVLPRLLRQHPNLLYLILGDGTDRARLEAKAKSLGLAAHVVFAGRVLEEEKVDHFRLADVYAMPSRGEGFGIVLLEAMACGVPTVASAIDGSREALRDGMLGILVDPANLDDVERGIREALSRGAGRRQPGIEYFSKAEFTKRVHAWLDDIDRR